MSLLSRRAFMGSVIVLGGSIWRGVVRAEDFTLTIARNILMTLYVRIFGRNGQIIA